MEIVISIAAKVVEYTVAPVVQWFGYSFRYSSNMENVKKQEEKLQGARERVQHARERVQHSVDAAINNAEKIETDVNRWLENADFIMGKVKEVIEVEEKVKMRCSNGACLNLKQRHQQSKKAKKILLDIEELLQNGKFDFMDYMTFESRMSTMNQLMGTLRDSNINIIGVWGMAGVGKTTLVREVAKKVKEESLFDEVAVAIVMQNPDQRRIQGEIADKLDLKLDKLTLSGRADLLRERLTKDKNKKILVILDDIWEKLDLDEIGIPRQGCKVVVTSRDRDILSSEMGTDKVFELQVLPKEEAWSLFEKFSGDSLKDSNLKSKAIEISAACAGLPLALVTVAQALKNKSLFELEDALQQLRRPSPRHQKRLQEIIYSAIELSYNHLKSPELQSFFLLCAQNQIGSSIFLKDLLKKCFGLRLFHGISTLEATRNRICTLVRGLKDSGLLLDTPGISEYIQMHDLAHDAALLIAYKTQNVLAMKDEGPVEWPDEDDIKMCTIISILKRDIHELPDKLECPDLRCLYVWAKDRDHPFKISDTFFKGMTKLKVLDLTYMRLSSLPSSLDLLTNLRTLCLDQCVLEDISLIGELKNLEILSLSYSEFKQLPREIGLLTRLRMLDLSNCTKLEVIPPNVLSCLIRLEELYVGNSFTQWEVERLNNERASLAELKHLSQLTTLDVHIPDANILPKDLIFEKLKRYKIFIGDVWDWSDKHENSRALKLKLNTSFQLQSGIKLLLNGIEDLCLDELKGVKSIIYELDTKGFQQLKHLHVQNNVEIKYIIDLRGLVIDYIVFPALEIVSLKNMINLEEICHGQLPLTSFRNLRVVKVEHCENLKFVFSSSIAKGLAQLQELEIRECSIMGAIVIKEEAGVEDKDMILLPQLRRLVLHHLPKLMSFLSTQKSVINDAGEIIPECDPDFHMPILLDQVGFPELEEIDICGINNLIIIPNNQVVPHSFRKLQNLFAHHCGNLKKVFPHNMLRTLQNLNKLEILDCASVEEIFEIRGVYIEETTHIVESMLRDLKLYNLPNLNHVWSSDPQEILTFENLREVDIDGCISLKSVFPISVAKNLAQLQFLCIKNCTVEEIVAIEEESETTIEFLLPQVTCLILQDLPELKCFYPRKHTLLWPSLKRLEIYRCPKVKIVSSDDLSWQDTNRLSLNHFPIEKVAFPNLEIMEISNLKEINQLVSNSIHKLQKFIVEDCESPRNIFPPNRLRRLQNLKELKILSCTSIEVVFEIRGVNVKETIDMVASNSMLRDLKLYNLPNLKHVWSSDPFEVLSFDDLREVEVDSCKSLKSLFPVSVAKSLVGLVRLQIKNCGVEEIVALEDRSETAIEFVFPQVTLLILEDLPELKCFYPRKHASKWPSLKTLEINNCPRLKISTLADLNFQDKNGPGHHHVPIQHPLRLTIEDGFHGRIKRIHKKDYLNIIWHNKHVPNYFCRRKTLSFEWNDSLINIFEMDMLSRLQILEKLEIFDCNSTTKVFAIRWANVKEISFQLKCLYLYNLPKLQHVWSLYPEVILTFQNLHDVKVSNCGSLRSIFPVLVAKQLLQLEMLEICDCGVEEIVGNEEGLKSVDTFIFPKLRSLRLERLPQLKSFYGGEYISKWALLKDLNICDCDKLKGFGSDVLSFKETSGLYHPNQRSFPVFLIQKDTFPNLEGLKFGWNNIENQTHSRFPAQFFSRLKVLELSGAIFEELCVLISEEEQYAWTLERLTVLKLTKMPRLMHLLKENPQTTMALQNLEKLEVSQCDTLKKLVPSSMSFHNLRKLEVSQCHGLICLLNPSTAKSLERLTKMIIFECKRMTAIVANEGDEAGDEIIFSELKSLKLHCLHNLTSFHLGNCTIKFPSLKESLITECPKLKTSPEFFSMPKLKSFKQAEKAKTVPQTQELWDGDLITTIERFSVDDLFTEKTKVQTTAQSNIPPPTNVEQIASAEKEDFNDDYDLEYSAATRPSKGKQIVIDEATQNPSFNPVVAIDESMGNATIIFRQEDIISQVTHEGIPVQVEEDIVKVEPSMGFPEEDHSVADPVESRPTKLNATNPITAEFIAAELVLFMEKFEKEEYNGQPPEHFRILTGSFDDFIQFKVPSEGLPLLIQLKERYGDFTAGFQFGATTGSFMLSMLCAILLDMQNSFVGNIDEVRLLEWRGVVRELMKAGFAVGFILDHLRDMARAVFNQRAKGVIENLNTQIVDLKKTFTELEFRRDQLVARGLAPTIHSADSRISNGLFN